MTLSETDSNKTTMGDSRQSVELKKGARMAVIEGITSGCTSSGRHFIASDDSSARREGSLSAEIAIPSPGILLGNADRIRHSD